MAPYPGQYPGLGSRWIARLVGPSAPHVRLSCDGAGTVVVGPSVKLGNLMGPRLGDGEILLQARSRQSHVRIGKRTAMSNDVTVIANDGAEIGAHCIIGDQVVIYDSDLHEIRRADRDGRLGGVEAAST